jgi:hypothetical protein
MKGTWVLIIILLSTIVSTLLFHNKFSKEQDGIDKVSATFGSLKPLLSPATHIYLDKSAASTEVYFWTRYALAPVHLSTTDTTLDTTLIISKVNDTMLNNKTVIWQNADESYRYILATKN